MIKGVWQRFYIICLSICASIAVPCAYAEDVTYQAGFDCGKARTEVEKYICGDEVIASLDYILSAVYSSRIHKESKVKLDQLKQSQKKWLQTRNACLEQLPSDAYSCAVREYQARIIELGGIAQLIDHYKSACRNDEWQCTTVADLERSRGNLSEAEKYYDVLCKADRDGDAGGSCYQKATVLEKQGKVAEASALYEKTCQARHNNDACGASLRLGPKLPPSDQWTGLYKNDNGTLFVRMNSDGKFTVNMDTSWANGHSCSFSGNGTISQDKATLDADPDNQDCKPELIRNGNVISLTDPGGNCRLTYCGVRGYFEGDFKK